ncbi:MAG: hypothetical protein RMJ43_03250 [Chloroherpetonaceae bacterium]|nr:hypothetical protein [Chloroherpetonaceae bacterium]
MPLTYVTSRDMQIEYHNRGPVDGSPDGTWANAVPVQLRCNSFRYRRFITKRIENGGFGAYVLSRPGKIDAELDLDVDVAYSGRLTVVPGNYANVRFRHAGMASGVWESTGNLLVVEHEFSVTQNDKAMQRLRLEGYADA